ncbi:SAM-dependent methyltransferase, partial [Rhizobium phaseoli]
MSLLPFTVRFDPTNQELVLSGKMRPESVAEIADALELVRQSLEKYSGIVYLNVKRLTHINMTAFAALCDILAAGCRTRPDRNIKIITSSVMAWSASLFEMLAASLPNLSVEVYDSAFYPGQSFVEDESFIPILRTQTKMTWRHERELLPRHG